MRTKSMLIAALAGLLVAGSAIAAPGSAKGTKAAAKPVAKPAPTVSAPLRLEPGELRFTSTDAGGSIQVFFGETPAKASQVTSAAFETQGWMFQVAKPGKDPAVIAVHTNPKTAEDGSYRLVVKAGGQTAYADVFITLPTDKTAGNLFTLSPRLTLDKAYPKGCTLEYKLQTPIDADYAWTVNDKVVCQGPGETKLVYVFDQPGNYTIRVTIKQGDRLLGECSGKTICTP